MDLIRDRRPSDHLPRPEDYDRPLSRTSIISANRRFLATGVQRAAGFDEAAASAIIRKATKTRFNARRKAGVDCVSVGEYLEYLNEGVNAG